MFNGLSALIEREIASDRDELLAGLSGTIVEIGAGNGVNFRHYPRTVDEVVAIEPEPYLRNKAREAAAGADVPVRVLDAVAADLPLADASCDAAVSTLVLCSVPDAPQALSELRRVLKPQAELRFLEHVRSERGMRARIQLAVDRFGIQPFFAGGCHCARETVQTMAATGFRVEQVRELKVGPRWMITQPHVIGLARVESV
jgi:ubiquinone/menaquinone biosynthesis C-methylase UbiE